MKKRPFLILFIAAMIISPSAQAQQPISEALLDQLDAAAARAEDARKKAGDFESPSYFPSEWEAVETQYAQARSIPRATDADVNRAIGAYNTAADSYDSIFMLTIPLYAQAREDEIMALRDMLIATGARVSFPEYLSPADRTSLLALDQYEAQDFYPARNSAARALLMYQALTVGYDAWLLRWEINEREFELYEPDQYDHAEEIAGNGLDAYRAGNIPIAMESAEEALLRYRLVLFIAWAGYAELRSSLAEGERLAALDTKTDIASRDLFIMAESDNKAAQDLLKLERYEEAAKLFINAEAMYVIASMSTMEKRGAAAAAIREAREKIEESGRIARRAEHSVEGGSQ